MRSHIEIINEVVEINLKIDALRLLDWNEKDEEDYLVLINLYEKLRNLEIEKQQIQNSYKYSNELMNYTKNEKRIVREIYKDNNYLSKYQNAILLKSDNIDDIKKVIKSYVAIVRSSNDNLVQSHVEHLVGYLLNENTNFMGTDILKKEILYFKKNITRGKNKY